MDPAEVKAFLTEHRVLQSIHSALTDAVRVRAPDPLLHMAKVLRAQASLPSALESESAGVAMPAVEGDVALQPLDVRTPQQLHSLLTKAGIDLRSWGGAKAQAPADLWHEVSARTALLCRASDGKLWYVCSYVEVEIVHHGRILVQTHVQSAGRTRQRFVLPSTAVRLGEEWEVRAASTPPHDSVTRLHLAAAV